MLKHTLMPSFSLFTWRYPHPIFSVSAHLEMSSPVTKNISLPDFHLDTLNNKTPQNLYLFWGKIDWCIYSLVNWWKTKSCTHSKNTIHYYLATMSINRQCMSFMKVYCRSPHHHKQWGKGAKLLYHILHMYFYYKATTIILQTCSNVKKLFSVLHKCL